MLRVIIKSFLKEKNHKRSLKDKEHYKFIMKNTINYELCRLK